MGIHVLAIPMRHKLDFRIITKLSEIMKKEEIDIVHTHGVRANLVGRLAARLAGKSLVVTTEHSLLAQDYPGIFSRLANTMIEKLSRGITSHFIAVSGGLKQALLQQGIPEDKITVIYNGLNPEDFVSHKPPHIWREKMGIASDVSLVAIVGRLHPVKGHRFFLQAAAKVLEDKPSIRFCVVGDGPERRSLEEYRCV